MKALEFVGDSLKKLKQFPKEARRRAGYEFQRIQDGDEPSDSKTLVGMPTGIQELRLWVTSGTYRVIYIARFAEAIYVLHAFQKKTQATTKRDLDLVRKRYEELRTMRERR